MKLKHKVSDARRRQGGFTLVEILIATAVASILLFGAIFSTAESYAVVRQSDARVHTQVHARRTMDRFIKDCRYASSLAVNGSEGSGWSIDMITGLDNSAWTWSWDPQTQELSLTDGESTEVVIRELQQFTLSTETGDSGAIARITAGWQIAEQFGQEAGSSTSSQVFDLGSSTWVRKEAL